MAMCTRSASAAWLHTPDLGIPLSAASAAALNDFRRFVFLYSFKIKCVNLAVLYALCALNLKLWLRSNLVSKQSCQMADISPVWPEFLRAESGAA